MNIRRLGRPDCGDLGVSERREWLVTNGRGSYAMGTVAGTLTRSYHGLLIAALEPPVARRLMVPTILLEVAYRGTTYALATNRWASGGRAPEGWRFIESFAVINGVPTWTYTLGDAELEVAIAMPHGLDRTAMGLRVVRAAEPLRCTARVLVADRDHHGGGLPDPERFSINVDGERAEVGLPDSGRTVYVAVPGAVITPHRIRWTDFFAARESERGLNPIDDYLFVLDARFVLAHGERGGIVAGLEPDGDAAPAIVDAARARGAALAAGETDELRAQLAIAADAFVIVAEPGGSSRTTIVAGYPWFTDWGRDTMIALPGLLIANRRSDIAEAIVRGFAPFVDGGMLPNVFPDGGSPPEYNTVDAALWYVEAIRACANVTRDPEFARDLFPVLRAIVAGYTHGTRYGIGVDPADGLLRAGVAGVQLTWMDAKVGDHVVTPRIGKPVEINALWFAALKTTAHFAEHCAEDPQPYEDAAARVREGFERFWNDERGCCFDVLDGPGGNDPAIRPNQLFAVALAPELLAPERARAVVDACVRELWTPAGLRTLAPGDPHYVGHYGGDQVARDGAYHQGTVWPWLVGAFVQAHLNVYDDPALARTYIAPLADALDGYGVGTLGEIFDGDAPHAPCGTIAQAWSVAELIVALGLVG
jgi:predicted glycogen debranching enzyme